MRTPILACTLASVPLLLTVACGSDPATAERPRPLPREQVAVPDEEPQAAPGETGDGDLGKPGKSKLGACAQTSTAAHKEASNVLFVIDRSGSMQIKLSGGGTRWTETKRGLVDFMAQLPGDTRAGAIMFPQGDQPITCCGIDPTLNDVKCACSTGQLPGTTARCDAQTYQIGVGIGPLDGAKRTAIEAYVSSSDPEFYWGTPLAPSLRGSIDRLRGANVDGIKSVVLLTDGYPTSCDTTADPTANDKQRVVDAAAGGLLGGTAPIRTFVMGVMDGTKGARADVLSAVASAGGTGRTAGCELTNTCHYEINASTFAQDMSKALEAISLQAFDCTFTLPPPAGGTSLDKDMVNVEVYGANGQRVVPRDTTHQDGWDFLPGEKQVQLYGAACKSLQGDAKARVEIVVGCTTVVR
jgi:hypothetical protein